MKVLTWCVLTLGFYCLPCVGQDEKPLEKIPLEDMVKAIEGAPVLADQSFYYDPGFKAVGSFAIHDHFAKRVCLGYLVSDGKQLSYRFIRAYPGLGSDNDAFQTELSNLRRVEYKFYRASKGFLDAYPERLSVKFFFEKPIRGLLADWKKDDIKFDIWDVRFGYTLIKALEEQSVTLVEK